MARAPQDPHAPATAALARLSQIAAQGVGPGRMEREVGGILAGWMGEFSPDRTKALASVLRDHLTAGAEETAEQIADMDQSDAAAVRHSQRVLAALEAARDALQEQFIGGGV